jgi:DNA uptake protein ComE-like DNA-binding protein
VDHAAIHIPHSRAERVTFMNGKLHSNRRAAGSVLIVTLIVCLALVSLTLVMGHSMVLAYRGSDNELAGRQADLAIDGAAQYAEALMTNVEEPGEMPDPDNYQSDAVPLGDATFWFIGEPDPSDTSNVPAFGLVDEASKLNLNTATVTMLENLPGMTDDLAEAIVAWRKSSSASPSPGESTSSSSSAVKAAPFETVEELAQVNGGTDLLTLYGNDTNLNHVLDPSESDAGATQFSPGLLEYVTVFSRIPNTLPNGTKRINVTQTGGPLTGMLNTAFGTARGGQITTTLRRAGTVKSVLEFYNKSGMTPTEFAVISGSLTMTTGTFSSGLINVNTASATVLECVPGITSNTAAQIISTRAGQPEPVTNLSWVASILGPTASTQAGPYLTAETYQVSADVAAVGRNGRGYRRTLFVIDNSYGTPQIVYRRNLASLGWALGSAARQTLAQQDGTPKQKGTP